MNTPSAPSTKPRPMVLGKYVAERELGRGGMGVVYAVRHVELGELFALKVMSEKAMEQDGAVDRFLREARAAARIRSEHAAKVYDVGRLETGQPYMLMQYLDGEDLSTLLGRQGAIDANTASRYVAQALDAIEEAHALGIVHRDLKPENLFLTKKASGEPNIKVLDFGISKDLELSRKGVSTTQSLVGSPLYMSPEQMRASHDVDTRSDIWSLGIVLFELCTGDVPFAGNTITEVCANVLSNEPPWERLSHAPAPFIAVVQRCLEKKREDRFASASDLKTALDGLGRTGGGYSLRPGTGEAGRETLKTLPLDLAESGSLRPPVEGRAGAATVQGWDSAMRERPTRIWPRVAIGTVIGAAAIGVVALVMRSQMPDATAGQDPAVVAAGVAPPAPTSPASAGADVTPIVTAVPTPTEVASAGTAAASASTAPPVPAVRVGGRPTRTAPTSTARAGQGKPQREGIY